MSGDSSYLKWETSRRGVRITGCLKTYQGALEIPSTLDGTEVTEIGDNAFYGCAAITSIVVPPTVVRIGSHSFQWCKSLESIELPDALTEIPESAFRNCVKLTKLRIPANLTTIGDEAFYRCHALSEITVNDRLVRIGRSAFEKCIALQNFILPESVVEVGESAFASCLSLNLFVIPENVEKIGDGALACCASLTDVKLFSKNKTFFRGSDGILFSNDGKRLLFYPPGKKEERYRLPETATEVGARAFEGVTALATVELHDKTTYVGAHAFRKCALESVKLGAGLTSLGEGAFQDCETLSTIELPEGLHEIAAETFSGCVSLVGIKFPENLQEIGAGAFEDCSALREVVVGPGVKKIGARAFNGCSLLQKLSIPPGVEIIGESAFEDCSTQDPGAALRRIDVPEGTSEIGAWCFSDISFLECVSIPSATEKIGIGAFAFCPAMQTILVSPKNERYQSVDDALYTGGGETLLAYPAGKTRQEFELPERCHKIAPHAFALSAHLLEPKLHAGVTRIGRGAFSGSSIMRIAIPERVTAVENDVFWGCTRLETVVLPAALREIGARAFRGCAQLRDLVLPQELRSVGDEAFFGCARLASLFFPATLEELVGAPFGEATGLERVEVEEGNRFFQSKEGVLFSGTGMELLFYPPAKMEPEYAIPDHVATIPRGAFPTSRYLTRLAIPPTVTSIETGAIDRKIKVLVKNGSHAHNWATRVRQPYSLY